MSYIKYTLNGGVYTCWNATYRVTTPSLIHDDYGTLRYTPLFAVNDGAEGTLDNHWYFRCGALAVTYNNTKYHVAISRRYTNVLSGTISTTITHSGRTDTTTTTTSKTVTPSGSHYFGKHDVPPGVYHVSVVITVDYGVTFLQPPAIYIAQGGRLLSIGTSSCELELTCEATNSETNPTFMDIGSESYLLIIAGNVAITTTTYPDETISAVAQGNFNYGLTYPSAPSLVVNSGGISATNNSGNSSFLAEKTLTGTVAYNTSATLSQAFVVTFNGDFGLG